MGTKRQKASPGGDSSHCIVIVSALEGNIQSASVTVVSGAPVGIHAARRKRVKCSQRTG